MEDIYNWNKDPLLANLLDAELGVLKRGLGGDFELVKLFDLSETGGRIICVGHLTYDSEKKQSIQIMFPTKYPYAPPRILAVTLNFSKEGVLLFPINPFHFGKGNQYGDGALCLFRNDFWNPKLHNIGWVLRRAQKWLRSATSVNGFKPDEIVEEHTAPINHIGQVLLPKKIELPIGAKTGELVLTQFKPNHFILIDNYLTNSPFSLKINKESFKWYKFREGESFRSLFPNFNAQVFIQLFDTRFGENLLEGSQQKNMALHIPSDDNPWHFFKIINTGMGIQIHYLLAHTLSQELYLRTANIFDDQVLLTKRVTIIGLGAIGSEVAKSLARNGVGHFNLFDGETFEVGNSVRHAADLFYIGENKVDVVKALIQRSNPNITVNPYRIDVLNDSGILEENLKNSDLCIVLTGEDSVDYMINDKYAPKFRIPFVFARVSPGAVSGSIQIVESNSACLRCLSAQDLDKLPVPVSDINYSELKPEYGSCSVPPLPGSEIDSKETAIQVSRIALQLLLPENNTTYPAISGRQYYWHGPFGSPSAAPFTWEIKNYSKDTNCNVCRK